MSVKAPKRRSAWFRDRTAAWLNSSVMGWTCAGWLGAFVLMGSHGALLNLAGVLLGAHSMVLAAYLVHEAAHNTLFSRTRGNEAAGEVMSFIAGSSYASFARIRHMHIRHHVDRADLACFDFKMWLRRSPWLARTLQVLEWACIPAVELLMHAQVRLRPFVDPALRACRARVIGMFIARGTLLALLTLWSPKALLLYVLALCLQLQVLNLFDAYHHTFEQYFVAPDAPLGVPLPSRDYELANTFSNVISPRFAILNLLVLNFGYHNAHHYRASAPWYRLPALHRSLYGGAPQALLLPVGRLVGGWYRHRVRRVTADDCGAPVAGDVSGFVGAHGVSFLTVV